MMKLYGASVKACSEVIKANKAGKRLKARARAVIAKENLRNAGLIWQGYKGHNKYLRTCFRKIWANNLK